MTDLTAKCESHEDMVAAVSKMTILNDGLQKSLSDLQRSDERLRELFAAGRSHLETYVDRKIDRERADTRELVNNLEKRLSETIDTRMRGVENAINGIPARITAIENTQNQQIGRETAKKETKEIAPKWASVGVSLVAIVVSSAMTLFIVLLTNLLR